MERLCPASLTLLGSKGIFPVAEQPVANQAMTGIGVTTMDVENEIKKIGVAN